MIFLIFILGLVAGTISAISWGAWLIVAPLLMVVWLPPQIAIATSKFAGIGNAIWAITKFRKEKKIIRKISLPLCIIAIIGWYVWAHIVISLNTHVLSTIIWILLLALLPIVLIWNLWVVSKSISLGKKVVWSIIYFLLSILGGFLWGIWPLYMANLMYFYGLDIVQANATDFIPYLALTITSVAVLTNQWFMDRKIGIVLFLGMMIWWYVGAHLAVKKWTKRVKTIFAVVVIASAVKILFF